MIRLGINRYSVAIKVGHLVLWYSIDPHMVGAWWQWRDLALPPLWQWSRYLGEGVKIDEAGGGEGVMNRGCVLV